MSYMPHIGAIHRILSVRVRNNSELQITLDITVNFYSFIDELPVKIRVVEGVIIEDIEEIARIILDMYQDVYVKKEPPDSYKEFDRIFSRFSFSKFKTKIGIEKIQSMKHSDVDKLLAPHLGLDVIRVPHKSRDKYYFGKSSAEGHQLNSPELVKVVLAEANKLKRRYVSEHELRESVKDRISLLVSWLLPRCIEQSLTIRKHNMTNLYEDKRFMAHMSVIEGFCGCLDAAVNLWEMNHKQEPEKRKIKKKRGRSWKQQKKRWKNRRNGKKKRKMQVD